MSMTKHIQERMNERQISETMLKLVENFAPTPKKGDKLILDRKALEMMEAEFRKFLKAIENLKRRGGLTLVECNGLKITTYFNSH